MLTTDKDMAQNKKKTHKNSAYPHISMCEKKQERNDVFRLNRGDISLYTNVISEIE